MRLIKTDRWTTTPIPSLPSSRGGQALRYALAILLTVLAFYVHRWIGLQDFEIPYITFFVAIALSAVAGGLGPGLTSTALGAILAANPFWKTTWILPSLPGPILISQTFFLFDGVVVSLAIHTMHRHIEAYRETYRLLNEKDRLLHSVIDSTTDAIYIKDADGQYLMMNEAAADFVEKKPEEVIGKNDFFLFTPETAQEIIERDKSILTGGKVVTTEEPLQTGRGRFRIYQSTKGPLHDAAGQAAGIFGISRDITAIRQAEEQLRLASRIFDRAAEGVVVTDKQTQILTINSAFTRVTGYSLEEVVGKTPVMLKSGRQGPDFYRNMWETLKLKGWWQGEIWNRRKNGDIYLEWLSINAIKDQAGQVVNYVGLFSDISLVKDSQQRVEFLATHDELTSLPNRTLFNDRLRLALARAERTENRLAVLFVDLDNFKIINDSLGHELGDRILVQVAERLRMCLRTEDTAARLGGDEFVLLLEESDNEGARMVAERILRTLVGNYTIDEKDLFISASIGIGLFPEDGRQANELMRSADIAMYRAKEQGKGTYRFFVPEMAEHVRDRLSIESGLRQAIRDHELFVEYQPQVRLSDRELVGAEALVRWHHEEKVIPPNNFIPVAEETGLIVEIDEWVASEVCRQLRLWDGAGLPPFPVSINVSGRHFRQHEMLNRLHHIVAAHGFPASRICIEITESILSNTEQAMQLLEQLTQEGFGTSIDDFGTGYSSLARLKRFPIHELKIDRSFVGGVATDPDDRAITRAISAMAKSLGLRVVAEGVETIAQHEELLKFGCDIGQGFLYGRPMKGGDFEKWLERRSKNTQ